MTMNPLKTRIAVLGLAAVFCAGIPVPEAQAQSTGPTLPPAEYKPLPVGTRVDYGTWKYEVEKSKGAEISLKTNDGRFIRHYGVFGRSGYGAYSSGDWDRFASEYWDSTLKGGAKSALDSLWPLTVGKKTRLTVQEEQSGYSGFPSLRSWKITLEVVGTENVVVGGVRYATYVVREQATYSSSGIFSDLPSGGYSRTLWYHPPAGLVLKTAMKWTDSPKWGDDEDIDKLIHVRYPEGATDLALKGEQIPAEGVTEADLSAERAKQETTEAEFEPGQPENQRIFFSAPEFSNINPIHQKLENADTRTEYAFFSGAGVFAAIMFLETKSDETVFRFDLSVKSVVDMLYYDKTHKKEWSSAGRVDSGLGSFSVKKFRVSEKNQECFGFSMEDAFGVVDDASSGPSKILLGYYCAKEGDPLSLSKITSLIKSITVKY